MDYLYDLKSFKQQLLFDATIDDTDKFKNIAVAGMGGSGIAAMIFHELYSKKPVALVNDYHIPDYVSSDTLFVAASFSGNTEETITATKEAKARGAWIVTIGTGGTLERYGDQHITIPQKDIQPRSATGYMLMPLINGFDMADKADIKKAYKLLDALDKDNSECLGHAKRIYQARAIPVIFGSHPFKSAAYKWKILFNENSKVIAYSNSFPELNHNDTMALAGTYQKEKLYFFAFDNADARITNRIKVTGEITKTDFNVIRPKGGSTIEKLFYLLHYGAYVSYHLAKLRKMDPTDISLIEDLKKRLKERENVKAP